MESPHQQLFRLIQQYPNARSEDFLECARQLGVNIDQNIIEELRKLYKLAKNINKMHSTIVSQYTQILNFRRILYPEENNIPDEDPHNVSDDDLT
jgi:hypothetical protein